MQQAVESQPSFVKDTYDFLRKVESIKLNKEKSYILFCLDVSALYPSVPRQEAREAAKEALDGRVDAATSTSTVLELMDLALENNLFEFQGKRYL